MPQPPQNYANHRSYDRVLMGLGFGYVVCAALAMLGLGLDARFAIAAVLLLSIAGLFVCYKMRHYSLTVQDRLIRLELRLRLDRVLTGDLAGKGEDLLLSQLIGLRFASDAELPDLVRKVLEEKITSADAIKRLVKDWQPDHLRI